MPPVPASLARLPHRRRTSVAAARAATPLPYPDAPPAAVRRAEAMAAHPSAQRPAPTLVAAPDPTARPAAASVPAGALGAAVPPADDAPRPSRPRPEPLPPLPPNAAVPAIRTSVVDLLRHARHGLAEADAARSPNERYAAAHLSALRAAAAVIAARATPTPTPSRRAKPLSAWVLLAGLAPDLAEWAAFFASGAGKRANAEAGIAGSVTPREADDLLRDAETFLAVVETKLRGASRPSLLDRGVG